MFESSRNTLIQNSHIQQSIYPQVGVTKGFDILAKAVAPNAFHNSDDRADPPKCHENTRVAVINKIMDWVMGKIDTDAFFLWLYGPAGCGKTAIARTVAERCEELGLLLASFIFFRTDTQRNTLKSLIASIAYCIALVVPALKPIIETVVEANPLIFQYSLETQLTKLICDPLQKLLEQDHFCSVPFPPLIIIDGLDECLDEDSQAKLISVVTCAVRRHRLPLRILIGSRPEQHLKYAFSAIKPQSTVFHLQLTDEYLPSEDIRRFLVDKFDAIKTNHPLANRISMSPWPSEEQVESLVQKSSGQFIFASLAARFVDSPRHLPSQRLDIVLDLRPTDRDLPFSELDKLYSCILSRASQPALVLKILGLLIALAVGCISLDRLGVVENILALEDGEASLALTDLHALLECTISKTYSKVSFHHSSFVDFLLNHQRSKENYINITFSHGMILQSILRHFRRDTLDQQLLPLTTQGFLEHPRLADIPKHVYDINIAHHLKSLTTISDLQEDLENFALEVYLCLKFKSRTYVKWAIMGDAKEFVDVLKEKTYQDLSHQYIQLLEQFVILNLENCPSPEKFQLISTLNFVLVPNSVALASTTRQLQDMIFPARSDTHFFWNRLWRNLCMAVFFIDEAESAWDMDTYNVLDFFPGEIKFMNELFDTKESTDGVRLGAFTGIEALDVLHGDVEATSRHVPEDVLYHRISCIAIAFYQYLCNFGSNWKKLAKLGGLHSLARKSVRAPWLSRRQTGRGFGRRSFLRWLRSETPSSKLPPPPHTARYAKLGWTLEILRYVLLVARKSNDLINQLSRVVIPYPVYILFPRRTRRVRRTIETYLEKAQRPTSSFEGQGI